MNTTEHTMKALPKSEQPYEKATLYGIHTLSDAELLAIIIRSGSTGHSALETAQAILSELGSLSGLCNRRLRRIREIPGIGNVKLLQLMAIGELSTRLWKTNRSYGISLANSQLVYDYTKELLRHSSQETVYLLLVDAGCRLIHGKELTRGTSHASLLSPRDIFCEALNHDASGIILVHNHPSGDLTPSKHDIEITNIIRDLGEQMQLPLMDHIIIGDNTFMSMKEQGYFNSEA